MNFVCYFNDVKINYNMVRTGDAVNYKIVSPLLKLRDLKLKKLKAIH